jgi:hypothetical protein
MGWLGAETRLTEGKAWKRYIYRAAVPDALEDTEIMRTDANVRLVDSFLAKEGPIPEGGRPLKQTVKRTTVTAKVPTLKVEVPLLKPDGPPSDAGKVPLLKSKVPLYEGTKSSSEVLNLSSQKKFSHEGAVASDRTNVLKTINGKPLEKTEEPKETRLQKAATLLKASPDVPIANVAQMFKLTQEEVRQMRRSA